MGQVAVAYPHPGEVAASFMMSILHLELYETGRTGVPPIVMAEFVASGKLVDGRNAIVTHFLETPCEWLLAIDADMGFRPDTLEQLLKVADPVTHPIVGGLCFGNRRQAHDDELQSESFLCFPTIYAWHEFEDRVGFEIIKDYPRDEVFEASATGAACVLIHRSVLERIRDEFGPVWFNEITHPKGEHGPTKFGEDMSFFIRCAAVDAPVHVHTGVKTSHFKGGVYLTEQTWDDQRALVTSKSPKPELASVG